MQPTALQECSHEDAWQSGDVTETYPVVGGELPDVADNRSVASLESVVPPVSVIPSGSHGLVQSSVDTRRHENGGLWVPSSSSASQTLAGLSLTENPPSPQMKPRGHSCGSALTTPPEPNDGPARSLPESVHPSTSSAHPGYSHNSHNRGDVHHPKDNDFHIPRRKNAAFREQIKKLTKKNAELSSTVEALSSQNAILSSRIDDMFTRLEALAASSSA